MRWLARITTPEQASWLQVGKTAVAIAVSWFVSVLLLQVELPIFAAIAALLVIAPSVNQSLGKGLERTAGVLIGVLVAWAAGIMIVQTGARPLWVGIAVLAVVLFSVVLARLARLAPMAANQVPISAMIMLALGNADSAQAGFDRILETLIGAAAALAINALVVAPVHHEPAEQALRKLAHEIAACYVRAADALVSENIDGALLLTRARELRLHLHTARAAMDALHESTRFNLRSKKLADRIGRDELTLLTLGVLSNRVIGISRSIADRHDPSLANDPTVRSIARSAKAIAAGVRVMVDAHAHDDGRTATLPMLGDDAPLPAEPDLVAAERAAGNEASGSRLQANWVLIGALLEDLRQARESLDAGV